MTHSRRLAAIVATLVMCMGVLFYTYGRSVAARSIALPVSDQEFWQLVEDFSEPNGYFRSDNFLSNENAFQHVIPRLQTPCPRAVSTSALDPSRTSRTWWRSAPSSRSSWTSAGGT